MATSRVKYQIEVYDITAASGYKSASSAISPVDEDNNAVTLTDAHCSNHFQGNKYPSSMPTGTDALTAEDLSAVFARKTYSDVDDTKSAAMATAMSVSGWSSEAGAVYSTIS